MLVVMEIALGVALGALGVALVGLVALRVLRRPGRPPADRAPTAQGPGFGDDDLPGFLEFPPGAGDEPVRPGPGWASLAPPSSPPPAPAPVGGREVRVVLTAMAVATLLLLGGVAAAALGNEGRRHSDDSRATT